MTAPKSALWSQTTTLYKKNTTILISRHFTSTFYTAILLPVLLSVYLGILQNVSAPQDEYGIGKIHPVRSLSEALSAADSTRDTVVFINSGFEGGAIDNVIDSVAAIVRDAGHNSTTLSSEDELVQVCRSSFQGTSSCFGAVVFHSSPDEGQGSGWNYTLRADRALGSDFKTDEDNNDAQIYTLPLQRAVDKAIVASSSDANSADASNLDDVEEWPFTDETETEREADVRRNYQNAFTQYNSIALLVVFYGMVYRLPGMMATEREKELSQLIDAMMPTLYDWEAQLARMLSFFYAFSSIYFPGWVAASIIIRFLIWKQTSVGVVLVYFILAGLAMTSWAIMGGTPFKKSQLSGAVNAIAVILLAVLAQAIPDPPTGAVVVLSLLFTPCNIILFFIYMAKFERDGNATDLLRAPDDSASRMPGILFWVFLGIQFFVYPVIAAFMERAIHGVAAESRKVYKGHPSQTAPEDAVRIEGLTKVYSPSPLRRAFSFIAKPRPPTVAVDNLDLSVKRGQIVSLLGANGSGKSTTLDAVAGVSRFSQGNISIDASGGIGIAPQKNVLWDELTVLEHLRIFNHLKSPHAKASEEELNKLIESIGLAQKRKAKANTLSGGQKRKLQLGIMLTGDSAVCCVDEVSSGIDPLSRRKIWDILLSERGRRTILLTSHFLDEADLLSDDIAILSKGSLRAQGSPVALKDTLGAGYHIHVLNGKTITHPPDVYGVKRHITSTNITYTAPTSQLAADVIRALEQARIEYRLSSPTIEDVFLHVAEEVKGEQLKSSTNRPALGPTTSDHSTPGISEKSIAPGGNDGVELLSGKQTGFFKQTFVLLRKRITLLKTNWIPYVVAFLIPIVVAAGTQVLVNDKEPVGCNPRDQAQPSNTDEHRDLLSDLTIAAGPRSEIQPYVDLLSSGGSGGSAIDIVLRESFSALQNYIKDNRKDIMPGGIWLGDSNQPPSFAYRADSGTSVFTSITMQNFLDVARTNVSITTWYVPFDGSVPPGTTDSVMLMAFFCIAVSVAPAFFGFYPNVERRSSVRSLQYSSGVRSLPLWVSHLALDYSLFLVAFLIAGIAYAASSNVWYNVGYLFPVFILYALTSILLAYTWSLFMDSQLSTFAGIFVYNVVGFAIYLVSFLFITAFSDATVVERNILIGHYVVSAFFPTGSLFRALMVGLNLYATACDGNNFRSYPGEINAYGGPILYLALQSVLLFCLLLQHDSGAQLPSFLRSKKKSAGSNQTRRSGDVDQEIADEDTRVHSDDNEDGLQVKNLIKSFGNFTAVDNVTFGVRHGEVFALLGPNGAGKSTTISLIRGDIQPSANGGDVFVEKISVTDHRALARANLGVCPQSDAIDNMTVLEHLRHYARLRGIEDVERQVQAVVHAVGLEAFTNVMAPHLSGGNKRKLSLGIALTGNPSVILLDEPSSGLDAAAKRIMWRTLETITPGRSILLTTHSMEEADALASRAGIIAQRMLAVGDVDTLRSRFGDSLYVHLVSKTAPYSTPEEMERMRAWVTFLFPQSKIDKDTFHGQLRFSVPAASVLESAKKKDGNDTGGSAIGHVILTLEENKEVLGIDHHSVSPTTLNDVFLSIVSKHDVLEEGYAGPVTGSGAPKKKSTWLKIRKILFLF